MASHRRRTYIEPGAGFGQRAVIQRTGGHAQAMQESRMRVKLCACAGCLRIASHGGYCLRHKGLADRKKKGPFRGTVRSSSSPYNGLYRTARWRRERRAFLEEHPFCAVCGGTSTLVDHIVPHHGDEIVFWDQRNWQALCASCHSAKTLRENNFFKKNL